MGSGAPRELEKESGPQRPLSPDLSARLGAALDALDQKNEKFRTTRDDERFMQSVKQWGRTCKEMDDHLRNLAKVLHGAHQLSLDIGSSGGGKSTKPWVEEIGGGGFGRLAFRLGDDSMIDAVAGEEVIATIQMKDIDYEWLEKIVVEWAVACAQKQR